MLNPKTNERELAYVAQVTEIRPIEGADRVEVAKINGWTCMVGKGEFQVGDLGVFFEADSKVPETEVFDFMAKRKYKVKVQKFFKGTVISDGLLLPVSAFGWELRDGVVYTGSGCLLQAGAFLTKKLGVTYADAEDNKRKKNTGDKYKKMAQRHPKLFKNPIIRKIYKTNLGKKILFVFFGKKKDKENAWPSHIAAKTDVERIQNMMYVFNEKEPLVATEKIDGSSLSIMAEKTKFGKIKQYICSRNVVFETPNDTCYYDTNIYYEAYQKYNFNEKIVQIMNDLRLPNIAIQMEVYGDKVQKRNYSLGEDERKIAVFHILSSGVKMPMDKVVEICEKYNLPHVPILDDNYILPDTLEELQEYVESKMSEVDGKEKEGIVFYDKATGQKYFKYVSPNFIMKYHG